MTSRLLIVGVATLTCLAAQANADSSSLPGLALSDSELSELHAAGLPDNTLRQLTAGVPMGVLPLELPAASTSTPDLVSLEHQQTLVQFRLAAATTQGSLALMQTASLPLLATPLAPLVIPTLVLPFPFFMAPPPKKHEGGH